MAAFYAEQSGAFPPSARWGAALVLGSVGVVGLVRGLWTSDPAVMGTATSSESLLVSPSSTTDNVQIVSDDVSGTLSSGAMSPSRLININTATAAELDLLPGIGPALADRIVEHRLVNGPYATLGDLDAVKGIGPKTIAKLVPYATAE